MGALVQRGFGVAFVGILLIAAAGPNVGASAEDPARFEVLQAAYFAFSQAGPTNQSLAQRCVLLETWADRAQASDTSREAAEAVLNNTTRAQLVGAQHLYSNGLVGETLSTAYGTERFQTYYRGQFVPTGIFDGTFYEFGGAPQTQKHYEAAFDAAKARPAAASINVSGAIVLSTGFLDFAVFSPFNYSNHRVVLRAVLVEDPVASSASSSALRYVVRAGLSGVALDRAGPSQAQGRINFTVDPSWVESRLAAILFVQSDGPLTLPATASPATPDWFALVLVPVAILVTGAVMAIILVRYITAERRARLR